MKISIGQKVLFSLIFVALIAVSASSIIAVVQAQKALKETTLRGFENVAEELFYTIRHSVHGGIESSKIVAGDPVIASAKSWTWQKEEKLKQLKTIIKAYEDITLIDPTGNVITSTDYNFRGSWRHKAHFKKALKGEACASNVRLIPNPTKLVISFAAPVFNDKKEVTAVVAMQLNLNNINRIVRHIKIGKTGHAVLLDEYGRYLVHSDENKVLELASLQMIKQLEAESDTLIYDGEGVGVYLANYFSKKKLSKKEDVSADEPNWRVVISQSRTEVYEKLQGIRSKLMVAAAAIFVVIILIAVVVTKTITNPIRILQKGADIFRKGELSHQVKISSKDEIGDLADSFNGMAKDLLVYQTDLEKKVEERTAALSARNRDMRMVMENVSQGFITVRKDGVMSPEHSAIVDEWFDPYKEGTTFQDFVGNVDSNFAEWFELAWDDLMEDIMPMEVVLDQMPVMMETRGRSLQFSYSAILDEEDKVMGLLVVIADITEHLEYEKKEAEQREILAVFKRVSKDKSGYLAYQDDAQKLVNAICAPNATDDLVLLKRQVHTLKGNSALFGVSSVAEICHQIEDGIAETGQAPDETQLDEVKKTFERLLENTKVFTTSSKEALEIAMSDYRELVKSLETPLPTEQILRMVNRWLLEPVSRQFDRIEEQARSLAARLGKGEIEVVKEDNDVRLDPTRWGEFWSSMSHVIRNAVDHGLPEQSDDSKSGKLILRSLDEQGKLVISIGDNGNGIDWDKVREKAKKQNLPHQTKDELIAVLFSDGFSTRESASATSGRGVGLAAVKQHVAEHHGHIDVDSEQGAGTTWRFEFPR